jgi:hypothetical protein
MDSKNKNSDLESIIQLSRIVNERAYFSDTTRLFNENDIYRKSTQEVTILGYTRKHKYSFLKRMKAKIKLYDIYSKNDDEIIGNAIINEIGNPNIFYVICNSLITFH